MPNDESPSLLDAAHVWKKQCLLGGGSIFSDESLWNQQGFSELHRYFVDRPDKGGGDFFQKLESQLQSAAPETKRLAAEMLWLMYVSLGTSSMRASTKRDQIGRVWRWSGSRLPESHAMLGRLLQLGVINPGTAYNTQRWREFKFLCLAMEDWFELDTTSRKRLLSNPDSFGKWLDARPSSARRQLRHILLHLLFPSYFEPMGSIQVKEKLLDGFGIERSPRSSDPDGRHRRMEIDVKIYELRKTLEAKHGSEFSFYESPLCERWFLEENAESTEEAEFSGTDEELREWFRERFGAVQVWIFSPGHRGVFWRKFFEQGIAAMGWDETDDLSTVASREEAYDLLVDTGLENPKNDSLAVWEFSHEIRKGDVILAKSGRSRVHGYGIVAGPYRFDPSRTEYQHVMSVDWRRSNEMDIEGGHGLAIKTLTRATDFLPYVARLIRKLEAGSQDRSHEPQSGQSPASYDIDRAMKDLFLPRETFRSVVEVLRRRKNVILQGPPGVGKSYLSRRIAWSVVGKIKQANVQMIQFHQSYSYEDFVQGFRPTEGGGFALRNGVFLRFCDEARKHPEEPFVFVIDEINRGNLSRIFGELLLLVESDKRGPDHALPLTYSPEDQFSVPENVHLLGMMNTADRSLAMVDYALRRRFAFVSIPPAFGTEAFRTHLLQAGAIPELVDRLDQVMVELNAKISEDTRNLGPGFEIGHSYFVPTDDDDALDEAWFRRVVETQVGPLLREYFFDHSDHADELLAALSE